jgi:hypothetical protein
MKHSQTQHCMCSVLAPYSIAVYMRALQHAAVGTPTDYGSGDLSSFYVVLPK